MRFLFLILLFSLIFSCEKNHHVIHVKATNIVTGEPYSGLKCSVVAQTPGVFESNYKSVYEGYLDSNGEATFDLKMKNNKSYQLGIELPDNTCYFNDLYFSLKHDLETQDVIVEFAPCAYMKLRIANINCLGADDTIKLYHDGSDAGYMGYSNGSPIKTGMGCYFYESLDFSDVPMGRRFYRWVVIRNGTTEIYYDTLSLDAGEYETFEINY